MILAEGGGIVDALVLPESLRMRGTDIHLGLLFSGLEPSPAIQGYELAVALDPRSMTEYGANHASYAKIEQSFGMTEEGSIDTALRARLAKPVDVLDITNWQKDQLHHLGFLTVGDVITATETQLMQAYYVGEKRSRRIRNTAVAAVLEYLSG